MNNKYYSFVLDCEYICVKKGERYGYIEDI